MSALALLLVTAAAFVHATWNLLAKRVAGGAAFVWLFAALSSAIYAPLALFLLVAGDGLSTRQAAVVSGSAVLHLGYYLSLQRGYRAGDLSLVYPLARGSGPLLSTLAAIALLGERPGPLALAGLGLVVSGVFLLVGPRFRPGMAAQAAAVRYGLLTGALIAVYTVWDKHAVDGLAIAPLVLDWGTSLGRTVLLAPAAWRRRGEVREHWRAHRTETLAVAVLNPLSYILVLTALRFTPVSYVAPTRELSILVGTFMGTRVLAEGDATRRLLAAGVMVLGVVALALG